MTIPIRPNLYPPQKPHHPKNHPQPPPNLPPKPKLPKTTHSMPPKRQQISISRSHRQQSTASYLYHALSEPENFSVVKSLAMFGVAVGFFASSLTDFILPVF